MRLHSEWVFPCEPEDIWPHFTKARMDDTRPLMFCFGIPKPMSCKVLEGEASVGRTRQCTTDRGTIDQRILVFEPNRRLAYRMIASTVWCRNWVGHLEDEFTLTPLGGGQTRVERTTTFEARGMLRIIRRLGLLIALKQAHAYAARNWRRLAQERQDKASDQAPSGFLGAT
ncbi:SRPBCC family protein [Jiella mangrovi]|uniref:SRPBCC family protein n=1 Tax=Jiella mangrovi TaxID=2821407 RepID=A0ABS4BLK8_9HYPH|nr:SRPBCC family protein [Jiella mangrovi]MBP0617059.1 SRPBCC family protein [Jiella mangrovi]